MADTAQAAAAENTADSREIRVFLSSTFRDFNEERHLLATQVFPDLNRRARERGVELVEVDLRWGVTQEQAEDGHALEICLQEIERCRPYFIGMLGDSYGSLTPPERQLLEATPQLLEQRQWLEGRIGAASYTELEIVHGLQLLRDPAMEGRAFFYFRDETWSQAKAAGGELGWRSEAVEDRQKLEQLRSRIRNSGYPLVEALPNPQAIADRIKDDLWALIERLFPEGEQPDALEKEALKHADYRRSRTRAGQYIGGEGYIKQLERWLEEGEKQILITGESGAGKSALIANWMECHGQRHPADVLYAHHLGCTNDANALRPMLGRLIDTASQQLLDAEVITEALAVPEDWWELVAKVAETLQTLGRWCKQQGRRWIWVLDGLDRLDPDEQNALPWLPLNLPEGMQVVASALACPAREILIERAYTTLTIEPLASAEQEQLIQRYLKRYTKELDGGLRQLILDHPLAGSPLFLKVLLEELRQCGRHDTLQDQLAFYLSSQTIDDLYERVMERLENDGSGEAVRNVMTALWASRAGLTESELLAITGLKPLQWAPIDLALEKAFGRNGNRLVFDHDYLRIAVQDRYLPTEEHRRQVHSELADWYLEREGWDERKAEEWPWQLQQAERRADLRTLLLNVSHLFELAKERDDREVINYWLSVKGEGDGELDELIADDLEEEIEKRREDGEDLIWLVERIAGLFAEAGLFREPLLKLRELSLELEEASDDRSEKSMLNSLVWLASAHRDLGQYDAALTLYQRCLEARERLLGPEHLDTLTIVVELGSHYRLKDDYEQAEAYYMRALETQERLLGPEHPDTLTTVSNLAVLLKDKGDYEQAEEYCTRCLEARERLLGSEHPDTLTTINNLAALFQDKGDSEQAEMFYKRALEAIEWLLGPEHPSTLTIVGNLAGLFEDKGDYEQAEVYYKRALEAKERLLGPEHPDINGLRLSLANLLFDQERYDESIVLRRLELEAASERDGRDGARTLTCIHLLAEELYWNAELQESEQLYREALSGRIAALGDDDESTMASRSGLGRCLNEQQRYDEALEFLHVCHYQQQAILGASADETLDTLSRLLEALSSLGRHQEALSLLQEAECTLEAVLEEDDPKLLRLHISLASLYEEIGELGQAETIYKSSLIRRENAFGSNHEQTLGIVYILAGLFSQQNRYAEAIPLRRRELAWRRERNSDTHPDTLNSIGQLAIDLRESGALEEAEALFRELLAARMQVLEPSDFDIGRALGGLAKTLEEAGKLEEAAAYRLEALDHRLEHEGPDDWWTNRARVDLARVLQKLGRNSEAVPLLDELLASMGRNNEPDDDDRQLLADAEELMRSLDDGL